MADYYPLITRAVKGLEENTAAARLALYDRARKTLSAQLRAQYPRLRESDIICENHALQDAIQKVEMEISGQLQSSFAPTVPLSSGDRPPSSGGKKKQTSTDTFDPTPAPSKKRTAPNGPPAKVGLYKLIFDFAYHFFGHEGLKSLRGRRWAFITIVGPTWGFVADLCTVFGPAASLFFLIFVATFLMFAAAVRFRIPYCERCAFPCVVSLILAASFGVILAAQHLSDTTDIGFFRSAFAGIEKQLGKMEDANERRHHEAIELLKQSGSISVPIGPNEVKLSGAAGQWLYDTYFEFRIPNQVRGTLLADTTYDVTMELKNRTSAVIQIAKLVTERYNPELAQLFKLPNNRIYVNEDDVIKYLQPNETITVTAIGNELLPKTMAVQVVHSLSREPSRFMINLGGVEVPLSGPRELPIKALGAGLDGLEAVRGALREGKRWSSDAYLFSAFPGDQKTYWDSDSGLKYIEAEPWVVTLYSQTLRKAYRAIVSKSLGIKGSQIEGANSEGPEIGDIAHLDESSPLPLPSVGSARALQIVNERKLAFADWKQFLLVQIKVRGHRTYGWYVPYRGRNSLPIILDANTGELIEFSELGDDKGAQAQDSPRSSAAQTTPVSGPTDYFPHKTGMTWTYAITIGAQEPIQYERISWPVGNGSMSNDTRGRFIPTTTRNPPATGDRFRLQMRVKGRADACGFPELVGSEIEILQDELGLLSDPFNRMISDKQKSFPSIFFVDRDQPTILLAKPHAPTEGGAGGFGSGFSRDGCSVRAIFFTGSPGRTISVGSQASDHLSFLGNSEVPGGQGRQGLHFQRSVDPGKPSPSERTSADSAFFQDGFIEDTWFENGRGLVLLIQRRNNVETMRWTLTQFSE